MRILDILRGSSQERREHEELYALRARLLQESERRDSFIDRLPLPYLASALVDFEGMFSPPPIPSQPTSSQAVHLSNLYNKLLALHNDGRAESALRELLTPLAGYVPAQSEGEDYGLSVSLFDRLHNPIMLIDTIVKWALTGPFPRLAEVVQLNVLLASGIDPTRPSRKMPVFPADGLSL